MSKVSEFYAKAISDESAKAKLAGILGDKSINEADNEQLKKIGCLAKELGFDITVEEAKEYLSGGNTELDMDDLDSVAGGKYDNKNKCETGNINIGDQTTGGDPGSGNSANVTT